VFSVRWCNCRSLDHLWNTKNEWSLELENPNALSRRSSIGTALVLILASGVTQVSSITPRNSSRLLFSNLISAFPRYLIAKGRHEQARAILIKHHAGGDENSPLVLCEIVQIHEAVRTENNSEKRPTIKNMLTSPANRRRLLVSAMVGIAAQWSGNTVVSYYLVLVLNSVGIKNATHQSLINGGLQIFNLIATVGCGAMLVDRIGRRFLFQWSAIGMTISYVVCLL
jgi:hypothetical protein